jgi:hypothetical protein
MTREPWTLKGTFLLAVVRIAGLAWEQISSASFSSYLLALIPYINYG